ncbi:hypothetical protein AB0B66_21375 [Catellatospora sp. NPDC049111]|uniref:hypothetical protein n=1 Tax=Catellatospora sp. NPDC049111 TaxID=3155271 RepID=UPI0033C5F02F
MTRKVGSEKPRTISGAGAPAAKAGTAPDHDAHEQTPRSLVVKAPEETLPIGLVPANFEADYVAGVVAPFLLSNEFISETPLLPMIDLALTKEKAVPVQLWGMLYEGWTPNPHDEGVSVFFQGYENRGQSNARKRIYMTATTPDLIETRYRPKIQEFHRRFLSDVNVGKPLMAQYFDNYYDLYWNLHIGATGDQIPAEVRQYSSAFNAVIGFWFPTEEVVRQAYMQTRATRESLREWLDTRVQAIIDDRTPEADSTFVHYWLKNGELGDNFRRTDMIFECFHNFLAFSQWGNMVYQVASRLSTGGDPKIRECFDKTMSQDPDTPDGCAFTPLDRFVMELFRFITPNGGSLSMLHRRHALLGEGFNGTLTPHRQACMDPRLWEDPTAFDPDRYRGAPTTADNDAAACEQVRLTRCPFDKEAMAVKDGRDVTMTNSVFGAVYSEVDGTPHPLVDTAGYAPFGFGYRRCAGEQLTIEFIKQMLHKVWQDKITFADLNLDAPVRTPVGPGTVLADDIGFTKG